MRSRVLILTEQVFIDEGGVDMQQCLQAYKKAGVQDLVLIPDHTPRVHVGGWHAGMAFALGFTKACALAAGLEVGEILNPHANDPRSVLLNCTPLVRIFIVLQMCVINRWNVSQAANGHAVTVTL